jgi:hypothetical protein
VTKPCAKPGRHVERVAALGAQLDAEPAQKRRRSGAQVDDRVPDGARHAADDLGFLVGRGVVVHAAQGEGARVPRQVALRPGRGQAVRGELVVTVGAGEEPPLVDATIELDDDSARQGRLPELQGPPA